MRVENVLDGCRWEGHARWSPTLLRGLARPCGGCDQVVMGREERAKNNREAELQYARHLLHPATARPTAPVRVRVFHPAGSRTDGSVVYAETRRQHLDVQRRWRPSAVEQAIQAPMPCVNRQFRSLPQESGLSLLRPAACEEASQGTVQIIDLSESLMRPRLD